MKRVLTSILILIMLLPCVVLANSTYSESIKKANNYIFDYSDYTRYLIVKDSFNYDYENGLVKEDPDFKTGGFLTVAEFNLSKNGSNTSYLAPGVQYWLIGGKRVDINLDESTPAETDKSGVRVTQYVKHSTKVTGTGTMVNPYVFITGYQVNVKSSDKSVGIISNEHGNDSGYVVGSDELGTTKTFRFVYTGNPSIDTSDCTIGKNAKNAIFSIRDNGDHEKIISVMNIQGDFTCVINMGSSCSEISFDNAGGSGGLIDKKIYYKYGRGWYTDDKCTMAASGALGTSKPTKTGYNYDTYNYLNKNGFTVVTNSLMIDNAVGIFNGDIEDGKKAVANWIPIEYYITYDANNGSLGSSVPASAKYADAVHISKPSRTGYNFTGWTIGNYGSTARMGSSDSSITTAISGTPTNEYYKNLTANENDTVTYKANWSPKEYSISYDFNGGAAGANKPNKGKYDAVISISNPSRDGYTFTGWKITGMDNVTHIYGDNHTTDDTIDSTTATSFKNLRSSSGTVSFKANWSANTFTVAYNNNNGSGSVDPHNCVYDKPCTAAAGTGMSRNNYTFTGWKKENNGSLVKPGDSIKNAAKSGTVTYYAQWTPNEVTLTVNGALGETITYAGAKSGSFSLNNQGKNTSVKLKPGTYTFTSNVAKSTSNYNNAYSRTFTITDSTTTINFYPAGAVYWYGNGSVSGSSLYSRCGGISYKYSEGNGSTTWTQEGTASSITNISSNRILIQKNSIMVYVPSGGGQYYSQAKCASTFSSSGYSKAKVYVNGGETFEYWETTSSGRLKYRFADNYVSFAGKTLSGTSDFTQGKHIFTQSSLSGNVRFTIQYTTNLVHNGATIYAFWLE